MADDNIDIGSNAGSDDDDDLIALDNQMEEALEGEGEIDFIDIFDDLDKQENTTSRQSSFQLTKYEIARLIGTRAQMIASGAPKTISEYPKGAGAREIAELELKAGKIPLIIRRYIGMNAYEDCDANSLFLNLRQLY